MTNAIASMTGSLTSGKEIRESGGKFIIVDGMDGAGKTTAIAHLVELHERMGLPVKTFNVWTSTTFGSNARKEIVNKAQVLHPHVSTSMAISAVLHCYHSVVKPTLAQGYSVILDRGPRASYTLQVCDAVEAADEIPLSLWRIGFSNMIPDEEIVILCDPEMALRRCLRRDGVLDGVESRGVEYHRKTIMRYSEDIPGRSSPRIIHNEGSIAGLEGKLKHLMDKFYL